MSFESLGRRIPKLHQSIVNALYHHRPIGALLLHGVDSPCPFSPLEAASPIGSLRQSLAVVNKSAAARVVVIAQRVAELRPSRVAG